MNRVTGHSKIKSNILKVLKTNRLSHALVFSGPESIGKSKIAQELALHLICEKQTEWGCKTCGRCLRIIKNQSENFKLITSENSAQIKIAQIREVLNFLSRSVDQGVKRVVIIDESWLMNSQASNALLKTLEEPPENVYFILITTELGLLSPTIRSRCQVFKFNALSQQELEEIKPGFNPYFYKLSRGQIKNLIQFTESEFQSKRTQDLNLFEDFWTNSHFILDSTYKEFVKDREEASSLFKNWLFFCRNLIVYRTLDEASVKNMISPEEVRIFNKLKDIHTTAIFALSKALYYIESEADRLDLQLFIESIWVKYARNT